MENGERITEGGKDMAVVTAEKTQGASINQLMAANFKRQLDGERSRVRELLEENAALRLRLERTVRKSKGRRRAIKGLEQALMWERLRTGCASWAELPYEIHRDMLRDIAVHKVKCEQELRANGKLPSGDVR